MVKIRLRRVGAKKQTSFRVVVADSRSPRDGRFIEEIGFYNPRTEPETLRIKEERALYWLSVGAQPTDSMARLLKSSGTLQRFERLRQGESLEALVTEAEQGAVAQEAEEVIAEVEEAAARAPEAEAPQPEAPAAEIETEEAAAEVPEEEAGEAEEAPEPVEEPEEPGAEQPAAETETGEAESDDSETEADGAEEEDEPEE